MLKSTITNWDRTIWQEFLKSILQTDFYRDFMNSVQPDYLKFFQQWFLDKCSKEWKKIYKKWSDVEIRVWDGQNYRPERMYEVNRTNMHPVVNNPWDHFEEYCVNEIKKKVLNDLCKPRLSAIGKEERIWYIQALRNEIWDLIDKYRKTSSVQVEPWSALVEKLYNFEYKPWNKLEELQQLVKTMIWVLIQDNNLNKSDIF
jgi:hypothetical protein